MMSNTIQCDIVSAHRKMFSGRVSMCIATGTLGELGIAPRHAPLMTTLKPGPVRLLMPDGKESIFFVGSGILEVMPHLVTVLADTAVRADDLDEAAAKKAKAEAERELKDHTGKMEIAEAQAMLIEAVAQLEALERWRKRVRINR
jgi:F-type H+-transporting ATPase subunit epsilon